MKKGKDEDGRFIRLFMPLRGELLGYVLAMGVPPACAEDVLQEAAVVMMRKMDEYEEGTNFRAWAYAVTRYEIKNYFNKSDRERQLSLTEDALEHIDAEARKEGGGGSRLEALAECVKKLGRKGRELVEMRYKKELEISEIARKLSRPVESLYVSLSRVRKALRKCVKRQENRWEITT
ncbi:MAG: sigma-70 family RNA polymerase sigma factor [Planctomycetes bacterium]|nr:sigma-70 family RNA polymerase sigma factor [Planctomycetota bacterium]